MSFDGQRAAALSAITKKGQSVTFNRTVTGNVSAPVGQPAGPPVYISAVTMAVVLPQEQIRSFGSSDKFQNDTLIHSLFRKLLVPGIGMTVTGAADYSPMEGDTVGPIEGKTWRVIGEKGLNPDGKGVILHTVIIRA